MKDSSLIPPRIIPGTTEDIFAYLKEHGVRDKDQAVPRAKPVKPAIRKGKGGRLRMTLDLHGKTSDEASRSLRAMLQTCREHGVTELLVIHGRGHHSSMDEGPVLKTLVHSMLDNELKLSVKDFHTAIPREGGEGATVLFLA
jgi:DNA-nicking Smr family endonuclease